MKTKIAIFALGIFTGALLAYGAIASKGSSKVVLENETVRVKDVLFVPGEQAGMHTHQYAHVGVILDGGTLKFNYPDGKSETVNFKRGGVGFREANVTHEAVNIGKTPVRVIEVEIKK